MSSPVQKGAADSGFSGLASPGPLVAMIPAKLYPQLPPGNAETRVRSLVREDLLEKEMATHYRILAWKIPWTEEPDRLQSMGSQGVGHD